MERIFWPQLLVNQRHCTPQSSDVLLDTVESCFESEHVHGYSVPNKRLRRVQIRLDVLGLLLPGHAEFYTKKIERLVMILFPGNSLDWMKWGLTEFT